MKSPNRPAPPRSREGTRVLFRPFVVTSETPLSQCGFCHERPVKLLRCSRCSSIAYCYTVCQKAGWKAHKGQCKSVTASGPPPDSAADAVRLRGRLARESEIFPIDFARSLNTISLGRIPWKWLSGVLLPDRQGGKSPQAGVLGGGRRKGGGGAPCVFHGLLPASSTNGPYRMIYSICFCGHYDTMTKAKSFQISF